MLPFLLVAIISSLATDKGWWRNGRLTLLWSLVDFLGWQGYFGLIYLNSLDTRQTT